MAFPASVCQVLVFYRLPDMIKKITPSNYKFGFGEKSVILIEKKSKKSEKEFNMILAMTQSIEYKSYLN